MKKEERSRIILGIYILLLIVSLVFRELDYRVLSIVLFIASIAGLVALFVFDTIINRQTDEERKTFSQIATSLAGDYESVYYVNTEDNSYKEYGMKVTGEGSNPENLQIISSGDDFFADSIKNAGILVHPADREEFLSIINKEKLYELFRKGETVHLNYRLNLDKGTFYYSLKATKGIGADEKYIVVGVKNVDAETRARKAVQAAADKADTFAKITNALASRYEVLYYVDVETNEYDEYSTSEAYSHLDIGNHGFDFFDETQRNMVRDIYVDDYPMMATAMEKTHLLDVIKRDKIFSITYRLILDGEPQYVNLRAVKPRGDDKHIVVGVTNINETMQREEEYKQRLDTVMNMANRDALTGVKNKNAYSIMEKELDDKITNGSAEDFAVAICDVNNLKLINDTKGHKAGDEYIREACMMICRVFKHSPVYRVGGDEFAVILRGEDFDHRNALLEELRTQVGINKDEDRVVVASGLADFDKSLDKGLAQVFEKADSEMYQNKKALKEEQ